jgi:hypothetical protein
MVDLRDRFGGIDRNTPRALQRYGSLLGRREVFLRAWASGFLAWLRHTPDTVFEASTWSPRTDFVEHSLQRDGLYRSGSGAWRWLLFQSSLQRTPVEHLCNGRELLWWLSSLFFASQIASSRIPVCLIGVVEKFQGRSIRDAFRFDVAEAVTYHLDSEPVLGQDFRNVEGTIVKFQNDLAYCVDCAGR